MVAIDSKTFDIVLFDSVDSVNGEQFPKVFECDDYIAPVVSMLNRKGYYTQFSCQGHVSSSKYRHIPDYENLVVEYETVPDIVNIDPYILFVPEPDCVAIPLEKFPWDKWRVSFSMNTKAIGEDGKYMGFNTVTNKIIESIGDQRDIVDMCFKKGISYRIGIHHHPDRIIEILDNYMPDDRMHDDTIYLVMDAINSDIRDLYEWAKEIPMKSIFKLELEPLEEAKKKSKKKGKKKK